MAKLLRSYHIGLAPDEPLVDGEKEKALAMELPAPELALGKYQIVEPLKTGGTAAIYLAVMRGENNFTREVVIKRPLPHLLVDRQLRAMFIDEAHIASRLSHPNVVQVIDLVANDEEVFLVLEYLRGRDLREILRRATELGRLMPPEIAAWVGAEVASGLDYAHHATAADGHPLNLVHRDVSPKNIRITDRGVVKVIDFGIARAEHRTSETAPGSVKGTLGYMSPEQVMGESFDHRSDVFSFGICLFQMLTGRNPFDAPSLKERIQRLIHAPIASVHDFVPGIDPRLDAIVRRCLERDAEHRYQRMLAVQRDLEDYLVDQKLPSARQTLVDFLETIFPDIHELPPRLQEVLSTMSGLTNRGPAAAPLGAVVAHMKGLGPSGATSASAVSAPAYVDTKTDGSAPGPTTVRTVTSQPPGPRTDLEPESLGAWSAWAEPPAHDFRVSGPSVLPKAGAGASAMVTETAQPAAKKPLHPALLALMVGSLVIIVASLVLVIRESGSDAIVVSKADPPQVEVPLPAADPPPVEAPPPATDPTVPSPGVAVEPPPPKPEPARPDPERPPPRPDLSLAPRDLLRTGVHLSRQRRFDDALLVYRLAFAKSGERVDPAIYKNLGLLHRELGETDRVRACFNMYLLKRPQAEDAEEIRRVLAASPATKNTACVSGSEAAAAEKVGRRAGARIDAWIAEAHGRE
ncbi:MAG: serine/threonine protein kinase [Deltaproteobacteria bacterium]|nr:serine/threonine protein kinase [Deltaproteobacteria bacterium]